MHPNLAALLRVAALARAANPMASPMVNPMAMAPQIPPGARPHPLALAAPRVGAPINVAPPMIGGPAQVPIAPRPLAPVARPARARLPHPSALPMAMHPHHAATLPRGARFRVPGGQVKVRP
jgi:hypothetical protein